MTQRKKLLLLVNPHAGKSAVKGKLLPIVDCFSKNGWLVTTYITQRSGEVPELVQQLAPDYDMVVCSGGDGTFNETVNGMMALEKPPVLGYIPAGTTNDFANSFRLPRSMLEAAENVITGVPAPFDVGCFNGKYFTYVAAFGAFTDVTYQTPQEYKNILGKTAYILEAAQKLPTIQSYRIRVEHDGGVLEDDVLIGIITNSRYVAGLPMGKMVDASMNDGIMEVLLIRKPANVFDLPPLINNFLLGKIDRTRVHVLKTRKLRLTCDQPISWTLDGEYGGTCTAADIENLPCALQVVAPIESLTPEK